MPRKNKKNTTASSSREEEKLQTKAPQADSPKPSAWKRWMTYTVAFALFYIFCTAVYGDVFARTAEENYVSGDMTTMNFLTSQDWGWIFYIGRWMLLPFLSKWIGAAIMAGVLTASTALLDRALGLSARLAGLCSFIPALALAWILYRGTNIYHRNEPSLIILVPMAIFLFCAIIALAAWLLRKRNSANGEQGEGKTGKWASLPIGLLSPIIVFAALTFSALKFNPNDILTARMQLNYLRGDWEAMIEDAQGAERPTRAVTAYYAIALVQTGQLLDRIYDIPFDYPSPRLDRNSGNEEYSIFESDCNLNAGLINPAYRCAMDQVVMYGPTIFDFKRLAIASLLNGETKLTEKYLSLIEKMPFQQGFADKLRPMIADSTLIAQNETFARILSLYPKESRFEQNYRQPAFLGYNLGLRQGSDATLHTAIAAALYSKAIDQSLPYIQILSQKNGGNLPVPVQQALTIMAQKNPQVAQVFPEIVRMNQPMLVSFFSVAKPIIDRRKADSAGKSAKEQEEIKTKYNAILREELKEEWLGTYFYYYYCENNDPSQTSEHKDKAGVN